FAVTPPPTEDAFEAIAASRPAAGAIRSEGDEGGTSRINLRLPYSLQVRAEEAAEKEGLSVNAWLVRAVGAALESDDNRRSSPRGRQSYTGWGRYPCRHLCPRSRFPSPSPSASATCSSRRVIAAT